MSSNRVPANRPWLHEPSGLKGGELSISKTLYARTDLQLVLQKATAYPQGVRLDVMVQVNGLDDAEDWLEGQIRRLRAPDESSLNFSLEVPGGQSANTLDEARRANPLTAPPAGASTLVGGLGKAASYLTPAEQVQLSYVLWTAPLPTQTFSLITRWPEMRIQPTRSEIDGMALRVAANHAK